MFILDSDLHAGSLAVHSTGGSGPTGRNVAPAVASQSSGHLKLAPAYNKFGSWESCVIDAMEIASGSNLRWNRLSDGTLLGCWDAGILGTPGTYGGLGTNTSNTNSGRGTVRSSSASSSARGFTMANGYATAQLDGGSYKVMMATYSGTGNEYDAYMVPTGVGNWNLTSDRPYYLQCIDATIEFSASEDQYIAKAHSIAPNQTSVAYVMQERAHSSATDNKTVRLVAYPTTTAPTFSVDIIDLGPITEPKLVPASISSVSSVTGTIDGGGQKTFTVSGGAAQVDLSQWWDSIGMGAHTVLLRSTLNGIQSGCKITFTKSTDLVSITTATYSSARRPASCRLIGNLVVPSGAVLTQEVTNNGNDASPTWEAYTGTEHFFSNETKTASQWGLAARVSIDNGKGSAVAEIKDSLAMGVVYEEE